MGVLRPGPPRGPGIPRETLDADAFRERFEAALAGRTRVFLVLTHEETEDPDHYLHVLRSTLLHLWTAERFERMQVAGPVLLDRGALGVRVVVFNRRFEEQK